MWAGVISDNATGITCIGEISINNRVWLWPNLCGSDFWSNGVEVVANGRWIWIRVLGENVVVLRHDKFYQSRDRIRHCATHIPIAAQICENIKIAEVLGIWASYITASIIALRYLRVNFNTSISSLNYSYLRFAATGLGPRVVSKTYYCIIHERVVRVAGGILHVAGVLSEWILFGIIHQLSEIQGYSNVGETYSKAVSDTENLEIQFDAWDWTAIDCSILW